MERSDRMVTNEKRDPQNPRDPTETVTPAEDLSRSQARRVAAQTKYEDSEGLLIDPDN